MKVVIGILSVLGLLLGWNESKISEIVGIEERVGLDTIIDIRDNNQYEIIKIDSLWWFNQNLNYQTTDSNCFKDKEENCIKAGRLYSYLESEKVCPNKWRLPTKEEFDLLLIKLSKGKNRGIIYLEKTWGKINVENSIGFNLQKTGLKHKKKYKSKSSMNLWLKDSKQGYHVHIYQEKKSNKIVMFRHNHEEHNSIIRKRKFAIRCVCEDQK